MPGSGSGTVVPPQDYKIWDSHDDGQEPSVKIANSCELIYKLCLPKDDYSVEDFREFLIEYFGDFFDPYAKRGSIPQKIPFEKYTEIGELLFAFVDSPEYCSEETKISVTNILAGTS